MSAFSEHVEYEEFPLHSAEVSQMGAIIRTSTKYMKARFPILWVR